MIVQIKTPVRMMEIVAALFRILTDVTSEVCDPERCAERLGEAWREMVAGWVKSGHRQALNSAQPANGHTPC